MAAAIAMRVGCSVVHFHTSSIAYLGPSCQTPFPKIIHAILDPAFYHCENNFRLTVTDVKVYTNCSAKW